MRMRLWFGLLVLGLVGCQAKGVFTPPEVQLRLTNKGHVRERTVKVREPKPPGEDAVLNTLTWLSRHQNPDGSWSATGHVRMCERASPCPPSPGTDDLDDGLTGLCILAFLGAGYTHLSKDHYYDKHFGEIVLNGLKYLILKQDDEGVIGDGSARRSVFNQILGTFALSEAYGLTSSGMIKKSAVQAAVALVRMQNADGGWGEVHGRSDAAATCWALMALASCKLSELKVGNDSAARGLNWLRSRTDQNGRVGYTSRGRDAAVIEGVNEKFAGLPTLTAHALSLEFIFGGREKTNEKAEAPLRILRAAYDRMKEDRCFFYLSGYATQLHKGPKGELFKEWGRRVKPQLKSPHYEKPDSCLFGSEDPDSKWSCIGGRVYATAIHALTLQIYYRYPNSLLEDR